MLTCVRVEWRDSVAQVWLTRPERHNAMDMAGWVELRAAFIAVAQQPRIRAAVLRGEGASFSSGADLTEFAAVRADAAGVTRYDAAVAGAFDALATIPCPVVAVMTGHCIGGGLELALGCDIRLCANGARIGIPIVRLGHALDETRLRQLIQAAGLAVAQELLLEGLVLDAEAAFARGLVHRLVELPALENELADCLGRLVSAAPLSVRWHKKALLSVANGAGLTTELLHEAFALAVGNDHREGVEALLARREPSFNGG